MGGPRRRVLVSAVLLVVAVAGPAAEPAEAAPQDVVISELMFNPASDRDADEFVEIANPGATAVDLSGWCFGGVTFCFQPGASIAAGGFLVLSPDPAETLATYRVATAGTYLGGLKNSGETVSLRDAANVVVASVAYLDREPWPVTPDGLGPSLELIDSAAAGNDPVNWAAATAAAGHTAGAANSVRATGLRPRITGVSADPPAPAPTQSVTVSATVTGQTGLPSVQYRVDFGAEQTVPMQPVGAGTFSAQLSGAAAGRLIRYRVLAANAAGSSRSPRIDDSIRYHGVTVGNGVTSAIPVLQWFIAPSDYAAITGNPTAEIERPAVLAVNGTVFDNVLVNIRGASSQTSPKPNWKFDLPANHLLSLPGLVEPVDEFALQADWSDHSHGRAILAWQSVRQARLANMTMFPVRVQRNAGFQGLYQFMETFDGTWRDREGYSDDQFFKAEHGAFDASRPLFEYRFEKKEPADIDFSMLAELVDAVDLAGGSAHDFLVANADLPQLLNYAAVSAVIAHHDSSSKNFYLNQESGTGRWEIIPWDLDHTYGNGCCSVVSNYVTPAEPGEPTSELMQVLLADPQWRQMYFRHLRSLADTILAPGQLQAFYDATVGPAAPEAALDFAAWPHPATMTYANQRSRLFANLNRRRTVIEADPRVPGPQSAAPSVVISELMPSPTGGPTAEYIELSNPSLDTAVDLSAWTLGGAVDLVVQQGVVLLPGSSMVFVANDPAFRAGYSSTVLVGDRFSGELAATETLTLTRPDGSVADIVGYGGAGWPDPAVGRSLELTDLAADNADPANWAPSVAPAGSPGSDNGEVAAVQSPGAAQIGPVVEGDGAVTVTWRPPFSDGGAAVTGYQVRAVDAVGAQVGPVLTSASQDRSAVFTGLSNGTGYRFQVAALNLAGVGVLSEFSRTVTPAAGLTVPGAAVIGRAVQGAVGGGITVAGTWTPPAVTGGSPITGYRVTLLRMSSAAADAYVVESRLSEILPATARRREFAAPEGFYRFQVVALNAIGTGPTSARSNPVGPR